MFGPRETDMTIGELPARRLAAAAGLAIPAFRRLIATGAHTSLLPYPPSIRTGV